MASKIVPLRERFPRWHGTCDCCNALVGYAEHPLRFETDTAAGSFKYWLCRDCFGTIESKSEPERVAAENKAKVNHAKKYSPAFGAFVAQWYGIKAEAV